MSSREIQRPLLNEKARVALRAQRLASGLDSSSYDAVRFQREIGALRRENEELRALLAAIAAGAPQTAKPRFDPSIYLG